MRHLILTTKFRPTPGGIEQYLHGLACALAGRGEDVEVVACGVDPSGGPGRCHDRDVPYEVRYVEGVDRLFGGPRGEAPAVTWLLSSALLHAQRYVHGWRMVRSLAELRGEDRPRVYVGVWNEVAHGWCAGLRRLGVPYRLFGYGLEVVRPFEFIRERWRARDFRSAEVVYACSAATAVLVEETFDGVDARVVRPGISEPGDRPAIEETAAGLRRDLAIGPHDRVLVTVGRLVRRKGVHRVLEALATLGRVGEAVRYVVAGDGPERERLLRLSRELGLEGRVDFLGRVDETTKWAAYELAALFVMPSDDEGGADWEGFGIVYLEAAVMGLPAVAGDTGGAREAVRDGHTGYLVDTGSREALAGALRRLIDDPEACRRMGEAARARVRREFSWERAAERVLEAP